MSDLKDPNEPTRDQEIALAQLTMLMRIYDIQLALLNVHDPDEADRVFEKHSAGGVFGPEIVYIPDNDEK